ELPWARPGARHTRDFEDMVLWLAQRTDRTTVAALMRCAWESVTALINRGVAELLDQRRLDPLYRIGVDEICYRHPHRYLTIIGDHDTGTVIDIQPGRSEESLTNFYEQQPDSTLSTIEAVSMDVSKAYRSATASHLPEATICFDPFHIMQWVNRALDRVYAESATGPGRASMSTADWTAGRWALRTGENKLTDKKRDLVNRIARTNRRIGRAWTLKEQLRDLYRLEQQSGVWAQGDLDVALSDNDIGHRCSGDLQQTVKCSMDAHAVPPGCGWCGNPETQSHTACASLISPAKRRTSSRATENNPDQHKGAHEYTWSATYVRDEWDA